MLPAENNAWPIMYYTYIYDLTKIPSQSYHAIVAKSEGGEAFSAEN